MRTSIILPAILIAGPALPALAVPVFGYQYVDVMIHGSRYSRQITISPSAENAEPAHPRFNVAHNQAHAHHSEEAASQASNMRAQASYSRPWSPDAHSQTHPTRSYSEEYHSHAHAHAKSVGQPHTGGAVVQSAGDVDRDESMHATPEHEHRFEHAHTARDLDPENFPAGHRLKRVGAHVGLGSGMSATQQRTSLRFGHGPVHVSEHTTAEHGLQAMHQHPTEMAHPPRELGADGMPAQDRLGRTGVRVGIPDMVAHRRPSSQFGSGVAAEAHGPAREAHAGSHHVRQGNMGHAIRAVGSEEHAAYRLPIRFGLAGPPRTSFEHAAMEEDQQNLRTREYESLVTRKNKLKKAAKPQPTPEPKPSTPSTTEDTTQNSWNEAGPDVKGVGSTASKAGHDAWDAALVARGLADWLMEREYEVDELD